MYDYSPFERAYKKTVPWTSSGREHDWNYGAWAKHWQKSDDDFAPPSNMGMTDPETPLERRRLDYYMQEDESERCSEPPIEGPGIASGVAPWRNMRKTG